MLSRSSHSRRIVVKLVLASFLEHQSSLVCPCLSCSSSSLSYPLLRHWPIAIIIIQLPAPHSFHSHLHTHTLPFSSLLFIHCTL